MAIPTIIVLLFLILIVILSLYNIIKETIINKNKDIQKLNLEISRLSTDKDKALNSLEEVKEKIETNVRIKSDLIKEISYIEAQMQSNQNSLNILNNNLKSQKQTSKEAFENWFEILNKDYKEKEKEYNLLLDNLNKAYSNQQAKLLAEIDKTKEELNSIKHTRDAAIAAARKEQEIKENITDYCIKLSQNDIEDINRLEEVKNIIHNKRVLSMLIWQTYVSKPFKTLSVKILNSASPVMGIYKITNIITGECYIGQSVNIAERFNEHAKCGLGIDTPAGNKLYKSMQEYGIHNFSWQLLETCKREELNEKEKFFIDLYSAVDFGLNSSRGINK